MGVPWRPSRSSLIFLRFDIIFWGLMVLFIIFLSFSNFHQNKWHVHSLFTLFFSRNLWLFYVLNVVYFDHIFGFLAHQKAGLKIYICFQIFCRLLKNVFIVSCVIAKCIREITRGIVMFPYLTTNALI